VTDSSQTQDAPLTPDKTRIGLVEDDAVIRMYLSRLLEEQPDTQFVGAWASAEDYLAEDPSERIDLLLVDLELPGENGIRLLQRLKQKHPQLCCLVLTASSDPAHVFEALKQGASGYLIKGGAPSELLNSLNSAIRDGMPLSPAIARLVVNEFLQGQGTPSPDSRSGLQALTVRELDVLQALAHGKHTKDIANEMQLSYETIRVYTKRIYQKLHVHSRLDAVKQYLRDQA